MATAAPAGAEGGRGWHRHWNSETRTRRLSAAALVGVGLVHLGLVLGILGVHNGFTTDEVDYLAKVTPGAPHLYWSAVRGWGTALLAAPAAILHPGLGLFRLYFAAVLSAGLVLAYLPWRRILHPAVPPVAALIFATTWFTTFYGNTVMPNLPIAYGCVAATGIWAALPGSSRPRRPAVALALVVGAVALVRPSDSLLLAGPLAFLTVLSRRTQQRKLALLALLVGEAIGWIPWVVEAYLTFHGPLVRWRVASTTVHGLHPRFAMAAVYPRLFDGSPGYCCFGSPAASAGPANAWVTAWFVGILVLSLAGLVAARRFGRMAPVGACCAVAGAFGLVYVGLLNYGALRFLLPIVGLLAIPIAMALVSAVVAAPRRARGAVAVGCLGILAAHLSLQLSQDASERATTLARRRVDLSFAAQTKRYVTHRPCLVIGPHPLVIAYYLRCHVAEPTPSDAAVAATRAARLGWSVVGLPRYDGLRGQYAFIRQQGWTRRPLHIAGVPGPQYAYLPRTITTANAGDIWSRRGHDTW